VQTHALIFRELDEYTASGGRVEKGDSLSLRAHAWSLVDQSDTSLATAGERVVQIGDGEADVMNAGPAPLEKFRDRRVARKRLEQLDELRAGSETCNASTIGIVERVFLEAEQVTIEVKHLVDRAHGDSNVRDARSTTSSGWHENRAPYMV